MQGDEHEADACDPGKETALFLHSGLAVIKPQILQLFVEVFRSRHAGKEHKPRHHTK